ncbi:hypothetical protein [Bifidobacterium sp. ESL0732]|uniref:hypothetical protein n=1 Tax=Bifidobacterium sp. ESL0732 TaxID=2983222 RepID=UPI0023F741CE|nr:hypothetical protein [Bifidobacterium sp. ESL0732]WEV64094.1 hypothetical protein OZX70_00365 [Bifidobacterium sp. ESL0732]
MKKSSKVAVASFAAACTLFAGIGFASAAEPASPSAAPVVAAQASEFNKTALRTAYDKVQSIANTYQAGKYTQGSWAVMFVRLQDAKALLNDANDGNTSAGGARNQGDIDVATQGLNLYPDALRGAVAGEPTGAAPWRNLSDLRDFYNKIKAVQKGSYPDEDWNYVQSMLRSSAYMLEPGYKDDSVYQTTVGYDNIFHAVYEMDPSLVAGIPTGGTGSSTPAPTPTPTPAPAPTPTPAPVDKKAGLRSAYDKVKDYKQSDFTAASPWAAFTAELAKAKDMLNTGATKEAFDAEATALNAKADALISIAGLKADIAKVSSLKPADYTEFTWYCLTLNLPYAKSVVADANATQERVNSAEGILSSSLAALKTPIAGQKTGADVPTTPKTKADLTALIAQADKLKQGDYNDASWKVFAAALKDAKDALKNSENSDLTRDGGIDDYTYNYVELEDAQSALVRKASQTMGPGAGAAGDAAKKSGLAQTGASVSIAVGVMALLAAAGAAVKLVDRKRA